MIYSDAELYSQNHNLQTKDANYLLDHVLSEMSFGEDEIGMDIGCASGDNTRDVFLSRMPKLKKLIAIDVLPDMIEYASAKAAHQKIEYHVANIEDKSSLKQWEGTISKAVSLHCLQWVKNPKVGFQNIYDLLKSNGEAALSFVLSSALWSAYPSLLKRSKWNQYLKDADQCIPESHNLGFGPDYFKNLLESLGFEVLLCLEEVRMHILKTDDELKAVLKTVSSLTAHIPDELRDEFASDLFTDVLELSGRNSEGQPIFTFKILILHARRL